MKQEIFRREAIEHQTASSLGSIFIVRPVTLSNLCLALLVMSIAIAIFLATTSYTSRETVKGVILPNKGMLRVASAATGILEHQYVKDGALVKKGDLLLEITLEQSSAETNGAQASISRTIEQRLAMTHDNLSRQPLAQRNERADMINKLDGLNEELVAVNTQVSLQRKNVSIAEASANKFAELHEKGFISYEGTSDRRTQYQDAMARLASLDRERIKVVRDLAATRSALSALDLRHATENGDTRKAEMLETEALFESERKRHLQVLAPQSGVVTGVNFVEGQAVDPGRTLLSIVPSGAKYEAHLFVPSKSAAQLKKNMKVSIRLDAFPYQRFGQLSSVINSVSMTTILPQEMNQLGLSTEMAGGVPVYRVIADLTEMKDEVPLQNLRAGMQFEADILVESRKFYKWIFSPIAGFGKRI